MVTQHQDDNAYTQLCVGLPHLPVQHTQSLQVLAALCAKCCSAGTLTLHA
jgi:hypothetical protein